jgi:hypothetical protein
MAKTPTPKTPEEPIPEKEVPSGEEAVAYEEVVPPSRGISIPETPVLGSEGIEAGFPEEGVSPEIEGALGTEAAEMPPTKVGGIPDIPEEDSWSEVVYEEGGPPPGFQSFNA